MQNLDSYKQGIHTSGQAADKVKYCCTDFSYRFGRRVLMTFQGALLFILSLQASTLITKAIDGDEDGVKYFDTTRFAVIMIFTVSVILLSYIKEYYIRRHSYNNVEGYDDKADVETGVHWGHGFYQR